MLLKLALIVLTAEAAVFLLTLPFALISKRKRANHKEIISSSEGPKDPLYF